MCLHPLSRRGVQKGVGNLMGEFARDIHIGLRRHIMAQKVFDACQAHGENQPHGFMLDLALRRLTIE